MSYAIHFDKWNQEGTYDNKTLDLITRDTKRLVSTEEFKEWFFDKHEEDVETYIKNNSFEDIEDESEEFFYSDLYNRLEDGYIPIYNFIHLLQGKPYDEWINLLSELTGSVCVIYIEDMDAHFIALLGCGMDMSDCIELGYYVLDGVSPVKASQVMSLSDNSEKLLLYCREYAKENGSIYFNKIKEFIENDYKEVE